MSLHAVQRQQAHVCGLSGVRSAGGGERGGGGAQSEGGFQTQHHGPVSDQLTRRNEDRSDTDDLKEDADLFRRSTGIKRRRRTPLARMPAPRQIGHRLIVQGPGGGAVHP